MDNFELLKSNMQENYSKYKQLHIRLSNLKDMIDGCLNRIAVSDDEEEVERYYNVLITSSIENYKLLAREAHRQWLVYDELFNQYCEEKQKLNN